MPTIVVVGDQSSGKSSVLESLSGVELPKGQGMVTRVPLILRLKGSSSSDVSTKITIGYNNREEEITEEEIAAALSSATEALAGAGKGIADKPITLNVSRPGAPDLTLVDLPGITRVPVQGQPDDIYERIHQLIHHYINPEESIILNVLSAAMDFSVCESIRMSRQVDQLGKRTLAVVTKVDLCPDGLLKKITDDAVKIGLGYICVRNRTPKEDSFEKAAEVERELFSNHRELEKLNKSMVGVEALANRLVQLQTQSIAGVLPKVLKQIDSTLEKKRNELQELSGDISNPVDASVAFFNISSNVKKCLQGILLAGGSMETSPNGLPLHYTASLHQEFERFTSMLTSKSGTKLLDAGHVKCIQQLISECRGTNLPNVVPQSVIEKMIRQQIDSIADSCDSDLPSFVHDTARELALSLVAEHAAHFPNLKRLYNAVFQKALNECKSKCHHSITRLLEMEKAIVYTSSPDYDNIVRKLFAIPPDQSSDIYFGIQPDQRRWTVDGIGIVDTHNLNGVPEAVTHAAMSVLAYWTILARRLADHIPRELRFSFNETLFNVTNDVLAQVVGGQSGLSIEEMMTEHPEVVQERQRLRGSLDMLSKSKDLISEVLGDTYYY